MQIGYVCTNFNNSALTIQALNTLLLQTPHEIRLVVVDNDSQPADRERLQRFAATNPSVEVIVSPKNVGYFAGLNIGIRHLRTTEPVIDYIVIGNNDLLFPRGFVDAVERNLESFKTNAVISPNIVTLNGEHQNPHVIRRLSPAREFAYDLYHWNYHLAQALVWLARLTKRFTDRDDERHHDKPGYIWQGHGSCYLLGPLFFQHFTELWAPAFMLGEEFFLSQQLEEIGMKIYYEPSIVVKHHLHATLGAIPGVKKWEYSREAHQIYRKYVGIFG